MLSFSVSVLAFAMGSVGRFVAVPSSPAFTVLSPKESEAAIRQMLDARLRVAAGSIVFVEDSDSTNGSFSLRLRAQFCEKRVRVDVLSGSMFSPEWAASASGAATGPLAISIWDGSDVLSVQRLTNEHTEFSIRAPDENPMPIIDPQWFGIPFVAAIPPWTAPPALAAPFAVIQGVRIGDTLYRITFEPNRPGTSKSVATFDIDSSRDWFLVRYEIREEQDDVIWTLRGAITPAQWGTTWYPAFWCHEQLRNGQIDWRRGYTVEDAELGAAPPETQFTWAGTGITRGSPILSYRADKPHHVWTERGAEPIGDWRARLSGAKRNRP